MFFLVFQNAKKNTLHVVFSFSDQSLGQPLQFVEIWFCRKVDMVLELVCSLCAGVGLTGRCNLVVFAGSSLHKLAQDSFIRQKFQREPPFLKHLLGKNPLSHQGGSPLKCRVRQRGLPDHGVVGTNVSQARWSPNQPKPSQRGACALSTKFFWALRTPIFVVFRALGPLRSAARRPSTRKSCRKKAIFGLFLLKTRVWRPQLC